MKKETVEAMKTAARTPALAGHLRQLAADDQTPGMGRIMAAVQAVLYSHGMVEGVSHEAANITTLLANAHDWHGHPGDWLARTLALDTR